MHCTVIAKHGRLVVSPHFHGASHSVFRTCLLTLFKSFGKRTLEKAYKIHAVSEYEKYLLSKHFNLNPQKIVVIPCGINRSEFEGLKKHCRDYQSILYVGRLASYKGVQYLIEALPRLTDNIILEIVGEGPFKSRLMNLATRLKLRDRIRFYNMLSRRELLQKFVDADVFCLLSSYEAYSMVIAEALVSGTKCIVSETSALTEWVDNKNCFGLKLPININSLVQLIESLMQIKSTTNSGSFKHPKIKDWKDVMEELEKIYTEQ